MASGGETFYKCLQAESDPECFEVLRRLTEEEKEKWLSNPKLLLHHTNETNTDLQLELPRQVVYGYKSVFVSNESPGQVLRLDDKGNIMRKYIPNDPSSAFVGLALHDGFLYINTEKEITRIQVDGSKKVVYRPDVQRIWKMLVVSSDKVIITDGENIDGRIYEYNPNTKQTTVCVNHLKVPSHISMIKIEGKAKYIISVDNAHEVKVYDEGWQEVATMGGVGGGDGQLRSPQATAVTDSGTILVADRKNHRICLFSLKGTFIRHVLTETHGINYPLGLAYSKPSLWITEGSPAVKCFQIAE